MEIWQWVIVICLPGVFLEHTIMNIYGLIERRKHKAEYQNANQEIKDTFRANQKALLMVIDLLMVVQERFKK